MFVARPKSSAEKGPTAETAGRFAERTGEANEASSAVAISTVTVPDAPSRPKEPRVPATTTFVYPAETESSRTTGEGETAIISVHSSNGCRPSAGMSDSVLSRKRSTRASSASGTVTVRVEWPAGTWASTVETVAHSDVAWPPSNGPVNATRVAFVGTPENESSNERPPSTAADAPTVVKRSPVTVRRNVPSPVSAKRCQTFVRPRFASNQALRDSDRSERRSDGSRNVTTTPCRLYCRDHSLHWVPNSPFQLQSQPLKGTQPVFGAVHRLWISGPYCQPLFFPCHTTVSPSTTSASPVSARP